MPMTTILFTNVRIFDGSGSALFAGDVLVDGNRIAQVSAPGTRLRAPAGASIVDGHGATLMPGLTEAHAHLSWPSSIERFVPGMSLPPEDLLLTTVRTNVSVWPS